MGTHSDGGSGAADGQISETPERLMLAYQNGDREAANTLIERLSPALYRFFALQTGDRRHADDLLQDVWLRIHNARHTYRPGEPLMPWVYAIARHVKVDAFRKRRSETYEQPLESISERPVAQPSKGPYLPEIDFLLKQLPESQREVISMLKVTGLSLEEVARATSSSVGAVKQRAHRAYERLRAVLAASSPVARNRKGAL